MAELGQELVDFSSLVSRVTGESFISLKELVEKSSKSSEMSESEKKINLLKYLVKTQQRMLRLNVLAKWCQQVPLIQYSQQFASTLSSHDTCFTQAADSMFFMHEGLQQARAPIYDVPSAIQILLTGTYQRLPKCTEDVGTQSILTEKQQKPALKKLDTLVRSKLLEVSLPKEISKVDIYDGIVMVRVDGEFKVLVTLGYRGHLSMWRILHLEFLVGERSGFVKLVETRRHALGDDLERRMATAENPFSILYSVLHELCVALIMDTVIRQVQALRRGGWKDTIRFELISDVSVVQGASTGSMPMTQDGETDFVGLQIPGVKVLYWLDLDKDTSASGNRSCPFLKIEPGLDLQIKCLHSSFVVDPLTDKVAEFSLDQSCIDVEKLLLRAICCNRYTRLLEINRELRENLHVCQAAGDVLLHCGVDEPVVADYKKDDKAASEDQEALRVRAYGSSYFTLGINIRNGRFRLHSTRNIIASSELVEFEEALNQETINPAEVFISLRSKSILHLFASLGRFLGLQVYEHGFSAVKVPKDILNGSSMLLMGFPECGSSYFLLMQLDKDFSPLFKLLEAQPDSSGKVESVTDMYHVARLKNIDLGQMEMLEDELNLSLFDYGSAIPSVNNVSTNQASGNGLFSDFSVEGSVPSSDLPLDFPSIVDEVFELDRGISLRAAASRSLVTTTERKVPNSVIFPASRLDAASIHDKTSGKRTLSDMLELAPSLQILEVHEKYSKRRKITELARSSLPVLQTISSSETISKSEGYKFGNLIVEANRGNLPSSLYVSALLHVVRRCSICIKHARLTSQMQALDILYVEEQELRKFSLNLVFRLPFASGVTWKNMCLRLGQPGSMYWDVKITDQHFRDLWELQKGSNNTPWGCGIRIANASDMDSHIRYDPDGVVLSYNSVEPDSIKKLVADIQRLSNARTFALGMRKLLGIRSDEKSEEFCETSNRLSEQIKRVFRIDAVGFMSLWFSFDSSGVLARFVVEWESDKDGCTMHVSPDQLWPHTKFLEDFINEAEVALLLDCIQLTAGPLHAIAAVVAAAGRGGPGNVPSSLLPIDVSVVLRGPYWIQIIYRKKFAFDMRCFAGEQVWLQPAIPPKGGPSVGGSLPCPQFRLFIMEHVAQELNGLDPNATSASSSLGLPVRKIPAIIGLGDDGGYGGGMVPLVALNKVLRVILKYLGVLSLFSQLPELLKEILGSILKDNEGALLNLDQEQPALQFFVGGYVFAVSVHRVQLLQVLSVKRFHHSQQQQNSTTALEELTQSEIGEICDYFSHRVTSEPYNVSRVASFITLLTLPISVLREFLKLITWKKGLLVQGGGGEKSRIELCLENHSGRNMDGNSKGNSNIHYNRSHNTVDFALTIVLDPPSQKPHVNAASTAGGAAWLPYCVSVRLKYSFGENPNVIFMGMNGSHGGRACWVRVDEWEKCKQMVNLTVETIGSSSSSEGDVINQGRLRIVADGVQRTLNSSLQGLRDTALQL